MANLQENYFGSCNRVATMRWLVLMLLLLMALLPAYLLNFTMPKEGLLLNFWWGISLSASKYGLAWVGLLMVLLMQPGWKKIPVLLFPILLIIGGLPG
ncbi:hypothetical protein [Thiolapillus sp.]